MLEQRPIVFLHIPKTAGQSIRSYLSTAFAKALLFPGYDDYQLALHSKNDLQRYRIFSGHFSPAYFDFLEGRALQFSILRDPIERIVSFYRYLRVQGQTMQRDELWLEQNRGIRAATELPLDQFLGGGDEEVAAFTAEHFENFYVYYFGTRFNTGRSLIRDRFPLSDYYTTQRVLVNAIENIKNGINIYYMDRLEDLMADLAQEEGYQPAELPRANSIGLLEGNGDGNGVEKYIQENSLDINKTRELLHIHTEFDRKIYNYFRR